MFSDSIVWEEIINQLQQGYPLPAVEGQQAAALYRTCEGDGGLFKGYDWNEPIPDPYMTILRETQIHPKNLGHGRGPGLVAALGSVERVEMLINRCREQSQGGRRIVGAKTGEPIEGSEGRALLQFVTNLVGIALVGGYYGTGLYLDNERWVVEMRRRINMTLYRSWAVSDWSIIAEEVSDAPSEDEVLHRFRQLGLKEPSSMTASIHRLWDDTLIEAFLFLVGIE